MRHAGNFDDAGSGYLWRRCVCYLWKMYWPLRWILLEVLSLLKFVIDRTLSDIGLFLFSRPEWKKVVTERERRTFQANIYYTQREARDVYTRVPNHCTGAERGNESIHLLLLFLFIIERTVKVPKYFESLYTFLIHYFPRSHLDDVRVTGERRVYLLSRAFCGSTIAICTLPYHISGIRILDFNLTLYLSWSSWPFIDWLGSWERGKYKRTDVTLSFMILLLTYKFLTYRPTLAIQSSYDLSTSKASTFVASFSANVTPPPGLLRGMNTLRSTSRCTAIPRGTCVSLSLRWKRCCWQDDTHSSFTYSLPRFPSIRQRRPNTCDAFPNHVRRHLPDSASKFNFCLPRCRGIHIQHD